MTITKLLTHEAVLEEIGARLAQRRLALQMTQAAVAEEAGLAKRTVERIEAGATAQLSSLVRVLRVLGLVERLNDLVPEAGPRPMDLLKLRGKQRQRASAKRRPDGLSKEWTWDEEG